MKVFQHSTAQEESLTLGSNTDDASLPAAERANMYVVLVNAH